MIVREIRGVPHVVDSCFYQVKATSQVTVTVDIGSFQAGGTSYSWRGQRVLGQPNFTDHPVNGPGQPISGTTMHCLTKVTDMRDDTNQTSVTYTLKGGVRERSYPYGIEAPEDGMVNYQVTFVFTE